MSKIKPLLALAFLLGIGGALYWKNAGMHGGPGQKPPMGSMPVITTTILPQNLTFSISAVGSLVAREDAEIHAEIAGQITDIFFEEGQPIKKGDILLQIDKSLIETDLARAKASYGMHAATFNRSDKLKKSGYVSGQQWDESEASLQEAKAAIDQAQIRLEKSSIRAPFDGIAGLRNFSIGDYADVNQPLTSVIAIDSLKVEFSVPERSYNDVQLGQNIVFNVDAWPETTFNGKIYAIDPKIDQDTRHFKVKALIPNRDNRLRPGMYARITISAAIKEDALMVPEEALVPKGDETFVFAVENGKAVLKKIGIGLRENGKAEAQSGLTAGAVIVTEGVLRMKEGMDVAPMPTQGK